jgi:glycosyltransferase involved in cell wall biosynthesis
VTTVTEARQPAALLFANTDWYLYNFRLPLARAVRAAGYRVHLVSPPGPYAARLAAIEGLEWHEFDFARRGINPFGEVVTVARLVALYRRIRPTHCHHFTIKCVLYGSFAARLAGVTRTINAITGLGHVFVSGSRRIGLLRRPILWLYRFCLGGTDVIFQNEDDRQAFAGAGVLEGARTHLIRGSGVDTARFRPDPQRRFDRTPVSILFASRLLWEKGLAELIEATRTLSERHVSAVVSIAGEPDPGNPSAVPHATLDEWRALPNVEFLGHRDDIDRLLAQADIVVLPSYREGTPRILLEAAAAGLPLVATDVPGCREVVRADENGILVPAGDAKALAGALERLALDSAMRRRMSARSREIACGDFDENRVLAATLAIYRKRSEE